MDPYKKSKKHEIVEDLMGLALLIGLFYLVASIFRAMFQGLAAIFSGFVYLLRLIFDQEGLAEERRQKEAAEKALRDEAELEILQKIRHQEYRKKEREQLLAQYGSSPDVQKAIAERAQLSVGASTRSKGNRIVLVGALVLFAILFIAERSRDETSSPFGGYSSGPETSAERLDHGVKLPLERPRSIVSEKQTGKRGAQGVERASGGGLGDINGLWVLGNPQSCDDPVLAEFSIQIVDTYYNSDSHEFTCEIDSKEISEHIVTVGLSCFAEGEAFNTTERLRRDHNVLHYLDENGAPTLTLELCES